MDRYFVIYAIHFAMPAGKLGFLLSTALVIIFLQRMTELTNKFSAAQW